MRLIDADALAEEIAILFERNPKLADEWLMNNVEDAIENAPTADVRENVKGTWIEVTDHEIPIVCECSACGWLTKDYDWFNYCPNCGADMRESDDSN